MKYRTSSCTIALLYPVLMAAIFLSCIRKDFSDCALPAPVLSVILTDKYYNEEPDRGLNTDEFYQVTLFFYNHNKELVATTELYECKLYRKYIPDVKLPPGSYDMVIWIGTQALFYIFDDINYLDNASLSLWIPYNHLINYRISHIYYGSTSFTLNTSAQIVEIPIIQLANDINFTIEGLGEEIYYTFTIVDDNGKYSFNSEYMPCELFGYQSGVLFFSRDRFKSRVTILRLKDDRTPMLYLTDDETGKVLYPSYEGQDANLISLIKKAYNTTSFDFDSRHVYNLSLVFDADMRATVYIDDWEVKEDNYHL